MAALKAIWIWFLLRKMFWNFSLERNEVGCICRYTNKLLDCSMEFYNHLPDKDEWDREVKWMIESQMRQ